MTSVGKAHQSGHARAFIEYEPFNMQNRLYLMDGEYVVTYSPGGGLLMNTVPEGYKMGPELAIMSWGDVFEDKLIDMFKAVAKALEIYDDEPGQAYKQGFAEGQTAVYKEWNESLRE